MRAATFSNVELLAGVRSSRRLSVVGETPVKGASGIVNTNGVAPNLFEAMQMPLLVGRAFSDHDSLAAPRAAIVNQALVRKLFGNDNFGRITSQERLFAWLSGCFGVVALVLACVGLHGLASYMVVRRTGEIGLRMALGALPAQALRLILRESVTLVALGTALGLAGAYGASRFLGSMLFGLSPGDLPTYVAAVLVLVGVALGASLFAARRATRVDTLAALRAE